MAALVTDLSTLDLKLIPAVLNKNLCAVAALISYGYLMQQNSVKQEDQCVFCFNTFHGNDDKNIMFQIVSGPKRGGILNVSLRSSFIKTKK